MKLTDAEVYAAKKSGETWKSIAGRAGFGWNGTNMDGGKCRRAFLRYASVLEEAKVVSTKGRTGPEPKAPVAAKAAPVRRVRKAKAA